MVVTLWPMLTDARPEQIKELFKRTLDTGLQHGTVTVLEYENGKPKGYEVTTYGSGHYHLNSTL